MFTWFFFQVGFLSGEPLVALWEAGMGRQEDDFGRVLIYSPFPLNSRSWIVPGDPGPRIIEVSKNRGIDRHVSKYGSMKGHFSILRHPVWFWRRAKELLTSPWVDYPRLPLLLWFTGLVQHAERQLQEVGVWDGPFPIWSRAQSVVQSFP